MNRRCDCSVWLAGCVAATVGLCTPASAQVRPVYGGHALDANLRVGSGGLHRRVPQFVPNSTNYLISGNITGGRAFRGFSPIRDTSQLFVGLPSSSLSLFDRDSVSIGDLTRGLSPYQPQPYFAPSQTVTNTGAIGLGLNRPGSSMPRSPFAVPRATVNTRVPGGILSLPLTTDPRPRGDALTPAPVIRARPSVLSVLPALPRPGAAPPLIPTYPTQPLGRRAASAVPGRAFGLAPQDETQTPLDRLLNPPGFIGPIDTRIRSRFETRVPPPAIAAGAEATGRVQDRPPAQIPTTPLLDIEDVPVGRRPTAIPVRPGQPIGIDTPRDAAERAPRTFPGAVAGALAPPAPAPPRGAARPALPIFLPSGARRLSDEERAAQRRSLLGRPVRSLTGAAQPEVDERMKRGDNLVRAGEYYRAAAQYQRARNADPYSPLPLLGKGHALIGSGDYLAAVVHLGRAIRGFPELPQVRFDLPAMLPRENILERRRADLENRLAANLAPQDRAQLQFLLGYIEYYSGLEAFGRNNIRAAAAAAAAGSPIKRFAAALPEPASRPPAPTKP